MSHQRHKDLDVRARRKAPLEPRLRTQSAAAGIAIVLRRRRMSWRFRSGARFSTRTTDLGPGGCFVDTTNSIPAVGSKLHVRLHKGKTSFETTGTVVYSQHGLRMGIAAFSDLAQERRSRLGILAFADLTGERQSHEVVTYETRSTLSSSPQRGGSASTSLVRLVQLMIGKGVSSRKRRAPPACIDPVPLWLRAVWLMRFGHRARALIGKRPRRNGVRCQAEHWRSLIGTVGIGGRYSWHRGD